MEGVHIYHLFVYSFHTCCWVCGSRLSIGYMGFNAGSWHFGDRQKSTQTSHLSVCSVTAVRQCYGCTSKSYVIRFSEIREAQVEWPMNGSWKVSGSPMWIAEDVHMDSVRLEAHFKESRLQPCSSGLLEVTPVDAECPWVYSPTGKHHGINLGHSFSKVFTSGIKSVIFLISPLNCYSFPSCCLHSTERNRDIWIGFSDISSLS